jgi:catabolite regulation protein CreA
MDPAPMETVQRNRPARRMVSMPLCFGEGFSWLESEVIFEERSSYLFVCVEIVRKVNEKWEAWCHQFYKKISIERFLDQKAKEFF